MYMTRSASGVSLLLLLVAGLAALMLLLSSQPIRDLEVPRPAATAAPEGLSQEHLDEIKGGDALPTRYDELREEYKDDAYALQWINVFDPARQFHEKAEEWLAARDRGDHEKVAELKRWFEEHFNDIH